MSRSLLWIGLLVLGLYAFFFLSHAVQVILFPLDVDEGEGVLLVQADLWARGVSPYHPLEERPHLVANYPPVFSWLTAIPALLGSRSFAWGRLLSVLCVLGISIAVYSILRTMGHKAFWAAMGGLLFPSFQAVYAWGPLYRVDMLGLFFTALGLALFTRRKKWGGAAACFILAFFTRQTFVMAPVTVALSLWMEPAGDGISRDRKAALKFSGVTFGGIALLFLLATGLTKGQFFLHTVTYNVNHYRWEDAFVYQRELWRLSGIYVAFGLTFVLWRYLKVFRKTNGETGKAPDPIRSACNWLAVYLILTWLTTLMAGKVGSAVNYVLEFVLALSIAVPVIAHEAHRTLREEALELKGLIPAILLLGALQNFHVPAYPPLPGPLAFFSHRGRNDYAWTPSTIESLAAREFISVSSKLEGPVFAEFAGWAWLSRHEADYHPFVLRQLHLQGLWDESDLLKRLAEIEFAYVLIQDRLDLSADWNQYATGNQRFSGDFYLTLLRAGYRPVPDPGLNALLDRMGRRFALYQAPPARRAISP